MYNPNLKNYHGAAHMSAEDSLKVVLNLMLAGMDDVQLRKEFARQANSYLSCVAQLNEVFGLAVAAPASFAAMVRDEEVEPLMEWALFNLSEPRWSELARQLFNDEGEASSLAWVVAAMFAAKRVEDLLRSEIFDRD